MSRNQINPSSSPPPAGGSVTIAFSAETPADTANSAAILADLERQRLEKEAAERAEKIANQTIPSNFVDEYLDYAWQSCNIYRDLLVYAGFLVMFVFYFLQGRQVFEIYGTKSGFPSTLVNQRTPGIDTIKAFGDIGSNGEFYPWLSDVVIPTLWDRNRSADEIPTRYAIGQNILLGGMRVRMIRMRNNSCTVNSRLLTQDPESQPRSCYDTFDAAGEDRAPFACNEVTGRCNYTWTDPAKSPGVRTSGLLNTYHTGGYIVFFNFSDSYDNAYALAQQLVADDFANMMVTRFVMVEMFAYTVQFDNFVSCKMFLEIPAGGCWIPRQQLRIFKLYTKYANGSDMIYDFAFLVFVLYFVQKWFREWFMMLKLPKPWKVFLGYPFEIWNFIEIVNLIIFLIVFVLEWVWWIKSLKLKNGQLPYVNKYPGELEDVLFLYMLQVYLNSVNTVLSFLKCLKFLRLNDMLNILGRTIANCQKNIIGVLILFIFVIFGYSITANTLFGAGMWEFRDFGTSFSTCLRMLMGDFDYAAMRKENRYMAGVFFWTFEVLGLFVLLNFITAFIADGFDQATEGQPKDLLSRQLEELWKKAKKFKCLDIFIWIKHFFYNRNAFLYKRAHRGIQLHVEKVQSSTELSLNEEENQDILMPQIKREDLQEVMNAQFGGIWEPQWVEELWVGIVERYEDKIEHGELAERKTRVEHARDGILSAMSDATNSLEDLSASVLMFQKQLNQTVSLVTLVKTEGLLGGGGGASTGLTVRARAPDMTSLGVPNAGASATPSASGGGGGGSGGAMAAMLFSSTPKR